MGAALELLRTTLAKPGELSPELHRHLSGLLLGVHLHIVMDGNDEKLPQIEAAVAQLCTQGEGLVQPQSLDLVQQCGLFQHLISLGNARGAIGDVLDIAVQGCTQLEPQCLEQLMDAGHAFIVQEHTMFALLPRAQQVRVLLRNLASHPLSVMPRLFEVPIAACTLHTCIALACTHACLALACTNRKLHACRLYRIWRRTTSSRWPYDACGMPCGAMHGPALDR